MRFCVHVIWICEILVYIFTSHTQEKSEQVLSRFISVSMSVGYARGRDFVCSSPETGFNEKVHISDCYTQE